MFSLQIGTKNFTRPEILNAHKGLHPALLFCQKWLLGNSMFIMQTSGSTGIPKSIEISRQQMEISASLTIETLNLTNQDVALVCLDTQYIAGIMMLVRSMLADMKAIVVEPSSNPLSKIKNASEITFAAMVPLQVIQLVSNESEFPFSPKALIIGGAPTSIALEGQIKKLNFPVYATYGMTETVSHIALRRLDGQYYEEHFHPLKGVIIQSNTDNCLQIQSPVTNNTWLTTNDVCSIYPDNSFKIEGRIDNVINTGGIKVQAEKLEIAIEHIFNKMEILNRFFITGTPDGRLGETVTLVIEGELADYETVIKNLANQFSKFEVPRKILSYKYFTETATLKTDKKATIKNTPINEFYF
jgi:o-succinylbenzoate---CoA ligase